MVLVTVSLVLNLEILEALRDGMRLIMISAASTRSPLRREECLKTCSLEEMNSLWGFGAILSLPPRIVYEGLAPVKG